MKRRTVQEVEQGTSEWELPGKTDLEGFLENWWFFSELGSRMGRKINSTLVGTSTWIGLDCRETRRDEKPEGTKCLPKMMGGQSILRASRGWINSWKRGDRPSSTCSSVIPRPSHLWRNNNNTHSGERFYPKRSSTKYIYLLTKRTDWLLAPVEIVGVTLWANPSDQLGCSSDAPGHFVNEWRRVLITLYLSLPTYLQPKLISWSRRRRRSARYCT